MLSVIPHSSWPLTLRCSMIALAMVAGVGGSTAQASRIHHYAVQKSPAPSRLSFAQFLQAGPALWSHATPRVPSGLRLPRLADGSLAPTMLLEYLLYRRALDPSRFDAHHPCIAPILANYLPTLPALSVPTIVPAAQIVGPAPLTRPATQQVPEPSTLMIGGVLLAGVALVKWRRTEGPA